MIKITYTYKDGRTETDRIEPYHHLVSVGLNRWDGLIGYFAVTDPDTNIAIAAPRGGSVEIEGI